MSHARRGLAVLTCVLLFASGAAAEELQLQGAPRELRYKPNRVALLPLRDYSVSPGDLFVPDGDAEAMARHKQIERIERAIADTLRADPRVELVDPDAAKRALDLQGRYVQGSELAAGYFGIGKQFYDNLALQQAQENLEKAEATALGLYQDVVEPALVADIALYLGLTHLDRGHADEAHIVLKRLFAMMPTQRFRKGYYAQKAERAFVSALTDFLATASRDLAIDIDRLELLMDELRVAQAVTGHIARDQDGEPVFFLVVYDRASRAFAVRQELPLRSDTTDGERLDRVLSAWLTCAAVTVVGEGADAKPEPLHPGTFIDTSFAHAYYLDHPAREPFHNLGFTVNVSTRLKDHFDAFGKVSIFTSLPDTLQDLQTTLNSARIVGGAGFTFGGRVVRGFVHPGLELHYLGDFEVITDPACKFWGRDDPRCNPASITSFGAALLFGVNIAAGLNLMLTDEVFLTLQGSFALYFPFSDASTALNYLAGYEVGAGVRF